jgi:hypothetical protein
MNRVVTAIFSINHGQKLSGFRSVSSSKLGTALDLTDDNENVYCKSDVQSHGSLLVTPTSVMMTIVVTATIKRADRPHCRHWRHGMTNGGRLRSGRTGSSRMMQMVANQTAFVATLGRGLQIYLLYFQLL